MKVLMLGWEYPPHIAGGLGTACHGLTTALARHDVEIHFVVPHLHGGEPAGHMTLTDSRDSTLRLRVGAGKRGDEWHPGYGRSGGAQLALKGSSAITKQSVAAFLKPYWSPQEFSAAVKKVVSEHSSHILKVSDGVVDEISRALIDGDVYGVDVASALLNGGIGRKIVDTGSVYAEPTASYGATIFEEVERFTAHVINLTAGRAFDVIHAHDWMTFPAGVALAQLTGKPLVVHVHSLEYDRSGVSVNEQINQLERFGLSAATKIIAVSHYTARSIQKYHNISPDKISVVHNGAYPRQAVQGYKLKKTWPRNVVLFLGRITAQKGPDYFVEVASRVIPLVPDVLFVLAGTGDLLPRVMERVQVLGLDDSFLFPGFLQGEELEEMFSIADLYVMPSTSEPFGISALEAISFDTPVIISKQSGVSEVLDHALKVDFWDIDRMADLIVNGLLHQELRQEMVKNSKVELASLHWDAAAEKTVEVYRALR
jgi:glycosyltransferase involved in cell wall biosynthesis